MIRELRAYDPKPGLRFAPSDTQAVDARRLSSRAPRKGWAIELNNATLPRLIVNRSYYAELSARRSDQASKAWLGECLQSANWLMKALDQRARTIVKVATEIVKQQEAFFLHGVEHLRPLTLRTVADAIGMHESTVSRVTSNKYLSCDARRCIELKYFFTSAIQSADGGEAASAQAVKSHIAKLIGEEQAGRDPVRRYAGRSVARARLRHRAAHRRQISRGAGAGLVGAAAAAEAAVAVSGTAHRPCAHSQNRHPRAKLGTSYRIRARSFAMSSVTVMCDAKFTTSLGTTDRCDGAVATLPPRSDARTKKGRLEGGLKF